MLNGKETDELMETVGESVEYVKQYVQQQVKITKLSIADSTATTISALVTNLAVGIIALIALLFLSVSAACFLAQLFDDNYGLGFLLVFAFYAFVGIIIHTMRRKLITDPTVNGVIKKFFPPEEDITQY